MKTFSEELEQSQKDWKVMNNPFLDDRPLTDETLNELGFKKSFGTVNRYELTINGVELYYYDGKTKVEVDIHFVESTYSYKTIGSVKMLIEALKGDE